MGVMNGFFIEALVPFVVALFPHPFGVGSRFSGENR